jgi:hypothetical protein
VDKSWYAFNAEAAGEAEMNLAIICACAPSLKSIAGHFFRDRKSEESGYGLDQTHIRELGTDQSSWDTKTNASSFAQTFSFRLGRHPAGAKNGLCEFSSFAEAHEYGVDDSTAIVEGYDEKQFITHLESSSTPGRLSIDDGISTRPGQALPLGRISPPSSKRWRPYHPIRNRRNSPTASGNPVNSISSNTWSETCVLYISWAQSPAIPQHPVLCFEKMTNPWPFQKSWSRNCTAIADLMLFSDALYDFRGLIQFTFLEEGKPTIGLRPWRLEPYAKLSEEIRPGLVESNAHISTQINGLSVPPAYKKLSLRCPIVAGNLAKEP